MSAVGRDGTAVRPWLAQRVRAVRASLGAALAASIGGVVLLCVQAVLLAWALQAAIFRGAGMAALWPAVAGFALLAPARAALAVAARRFGQRAGAATVAAARAELVVHLQALGPAWLATRSSGELATTLIEGVDALGPYVARYLPQRAVAAALPAVLLAAVFPADWVAGLVLLLTAPLVPLFMVLLGGAAERASQRRWTRLIRLGGRFLDALRGLVALRLAGAGERECSALAAASEDYRRETMAVLRVAFLSSLVLEFFATISIAVVAVLVGFRLLWGEVDFARGMFVLLLAPEFYLPLRALGALRHARMDALSAAADMQALLQRPVPATPVAPRAGAMPSGRAPEIVFEGVRVAHTDGRVALDGLDLRLPAGTSTVLVGDSGGGKSTLLLALLGFLPLQAGRIRIDGQDLAELDPEAWRRSLAWLPQRPHLFVGSLRENVLLARPEADEDALHRAAAASGLDAVVAALPQGWRTPLGGQGHGVSGGQAQRIALARALLREAPVWLLDEPTQHLDPDSAQTVDRALAAGAHGRTVLHVAHRLQAARRADAVAVVRGGRVVEHGPPERLLHARGAFARLLDAEAVA